MAERGLPHRLVRLFVLGAAVTVAFDEAVSAALTLPYSSAQAEGQIHKLKLIKQQMYGRVKFDLLRHRVLLAA